MRSPNRRISVSYTMRQLGDSQKQCSAEETAQVSEHQNIIANFAFLSVFIETTEMRGEQIIVHSYRRWDAELQQWTGHEPRSTFFIRARISVRRWQCSTMLPLLIWNFAGKPYSGLFVCWTLQTILFSRWSMWWRPVFLLILFISQPYSKICRWPSILFNCTPKAMRNMLRIWFFSFSNWYQV